jgi:YD repeat-containing protein
MKNTILTIAILIIGFSAKAQVTVTYTYDNLQRLTQASYSNGVGIQYSYDELGNRKQETKTSTLSVEEMQPLNSLTVYPNPFQDVLNIQTKEDNLISVQLFDITGRSFKKEKVSGSS